MKTILLTGATDGIGLETAKMLGQSDEVGTLLLHGRSAAKLDSAKQEVLNSANGRDIKIEIYIADLSDLNETVMMADEIASNHSSLDVIINNAGILKTASPIAKNGLDVRIVVNTLAPYLLTKKLLPLIGVAGRVVNLSSAAQAPVNLDFVMGKTQIDEAFAAYAQSKLAITMWSKVLGEKLKGSGPLVVSVNPGSLLGSKMVKEGFGVDGGDLSIGADILYRASLSDEFENRHGQYYDNDAHCFSDPHPDALIDGVSEHVTETVDKLCQEVLG